MLLLSFLSRPSVRKVDLDLFGGTRFESFNNYDQRLVCVTSELDKAKVWMSG